MGKPVTFGITLFEANPPPPAHVHTKTLRNAKGPRVSVFGVRMVPLSAPRPFWGPAPGPGAQGEEGLFQQPAEGQGAEEGVWRPKISRGMAPFGGVPVGLSLNSKEEKKRYPPKSKTLPHAKSGLKPGSPSKSSKLESEISAWVGAGRLHKSNKNFQTLSRTDKNHTHIYKAPRAPNS